MRDGLLCSGIRDSSGIQGPLSVLGDDLADLLEHLEREARLALLLLARALGTVQLLQGAAHAVHEVDTVLDGLVLGLEALDVLGLVPRAELAVLSAQLVDDGLGHGWAQQRRHEGALLGIDAQRVDLVVHHSLVLLLGPRDRDVHARHHARPLGLARDPVVHEAAGHQLVDDDVAGNARLWVEDGVHETDAGDGDRKFDVQDGGARLVRRESRGQFNV